MIEMGGRGSNKIGLIARSMMVSAMKRRLSVNCGRQVKSVCVDHSQSGLGHVLGCDFDEFKKERLMNYINSLYRPCVKFVVFSQSANDLGQTLGLPLYEYKYETIMDFIKQKRG